jgi:membrane associated rhomboid family serine protease
VCGAPLAQASPQQLPLRERYNLNYARAILSRPYIFTIVFLVLNFFVFLLMWQFSGMATSVLWAGFPETVLRAFGAKTNYLVGYDHEYWRLITPVFIHVNLPHLLINMYSLWVIGPWVEKLYGSAKFVVFWVATGIAGVLASYLTVIWIGGCAFRVWIEVSTRTPGGIQTRIRNRNAACHSTEPGDWFCGARLYR